MILSILQSVTLIFQITTLWVSVLPLFESDDEVHIKYRLYLSEFLKSSFKNALLLIKHHTIDFKKIVFVIKLLNGQGYLINLSIVTVT